MCEDKLDVIFTREYDTVSSMIGKKCFVLKLKKRSLPVDNELLLHEEDLMPLVRAISKFMDKLHKENSRNDKLY